MEPEVSGVEDPASNVGAVLQPIQPLKEKHHRPGTMVCRHSCYLSIISMSLLLVDDHLQEIDLISVIGVEGVGFIVCKDVYCSGGNPVLL